MAKNPPPIDTRTSHGVMIATGSGIQIGRLSAFTPAQSRPVTPIYELNPNTSGEPVENVPGNLGGLTISVSRYDLYKTRMEEAFGTTDFTMLSDQNRPFIIMEFIRVPAGDSGSFTSEVYQYTGCWFTSIGRPYSSGGDRIVNVSANFAYLRKERIQ